MYATFYVESCKNLKSIKNGKVCGIPGETLPKEYHFSRLEKERKKLWKRLPGFPFLS
jgi:hypothetical protein